MNIKNNMPLSSFSKTEIELLHLIFEKSGHFDDIEDIEQLLNEAIKMADHEIIKESVISFKNHLLGLNVNDINLIVSGMPYDLSFIV